MAGTKIRRRAEVQRSECVACGCCVRVCPVQAIEIIRGCYARVQTQRCVGCGRCAKACPASVIELKEAQV